ncbi:DUF2279 domain-containing protein [Flavihumibacter fluvii]|uniref:DUF2279 domain-containing protein n=1 Tax=Flavihumibacter fluvii TaxID=2838157 RepID=UPI001BDDE933|nr:DUF2279 domain-containing protein [Flavihumibacter fluvii]ULQ53916.1 YfiM family protein [Flavihumibacter fluvii]
MGCFTGFTTFAQDPQPPQKSIPPALTLDTSNIPWQEKITPAHPTSKSSRNKKVWLVSGAHAIVWTGTYIALNKAWYADYPKENFHTFNDFHEWNQMDKAGHIWTTYQLARISGAAWKWTGLPEKTAIWLGGGSALAFQSIIEIQDGFSQKWGFSWWDMAANTIGSGAYIAQELGWKEQRIQIKMGYWPYNYPEDLESRSNDLFGTGSIERILKDYNSQTYWISANLRRFIPVSHIPRWLNLSLGYSSDLMLGGMDNTWTDDQGNTVDRTDIPRIRRYYLSIDADLTRINTRSKFLRSLFSVCNAIKIPAPALEFNSDGKFRFHALHQ